MPPTLAAVVALPQLSLRVRTGVDRLDTLVRWAAVSELEDPTPFLEGGELLLTTGMRMTAERAEPYVARLEERGVAGIGFGVGIAHDDVPAELLAAAERHGLPLLEVPQPVPFIAIGKAVSKLLAAEQYEDVVRASKAQGDLTLAALRGPQTVVSVLARVLDGWVLLLDPAGQVLHATPGWARERAGEITGELVRLRGRHSALALADPDSQVIVRPLGSTGFLAVGMRPGQPPVIHTIVDAAVSLLTLNAEKSQAQRVEERRLRVGLLELLLGGGARRAIRRVGLPAALADGPVCVLACGCGAEMLDALDASPVGGRFLAGARESYVVVLAALPDVAAVIEIARAYGPVGVSDPVATVTTADRTVTADSAGSAGRGGLAGGLDQAVRALAAARRSGALVFRHADLPGLGLLGLVDREAAQGFAAALLGPLPPVLVESLRTYLMANGHWEAAAQSLGVHRHTLRHRMRKTAELLHRDLDDPAVRAELWVALAVAGTRTPDAGGPPATDSGVGGPTGMSP